MHCLGLVMHFSGIWPMWANKYRAEVNPTSSRFYVSASKLLQLHDSRNSTSTASLTSHLGASKLLQLYGNIKSTSTASKTTSPGWSKSIDLHFFCCRRNAYKDALSMQFVAPLAGISRYTVPFNSACCNAQELNSSTPREPAFNRLWVPLLARQLRCGSCEVKIWIEIN
jgi:hypothetical protein